MPTLTDLTTVKSRFPTWEKYIRLDSDEDAATLDDRLTWVIEDAESEMQELLPGLTATNITAPLTRHLLNIVRKHAFDIKNSTRQWGEQGRPQILKDYEASLQTLQRYREGDLEYRDDADIDEDDPEHVRMDGPRRRFTDGKWFHPDDTYDEWFRR